MGAAEITGWLLGLGYTYAAARKRVRLLSPADEVFLAGQARSIVSSARLAPGLANGKWRNLTPYTLHVPGGNMGYPAFWVRDAVMMLDSSLIALREVEDWIRLISSVIRDRDWQVRPGVVVPAFSVPDHINFDGEATYYPGNYETGAQQGGGSWGKYPPLDDQFYFISAAYHHWKQSGNTALFRSRIKTAFGEMQLSELCERAYRRVPSDQDTGLCIAGNVDTENAKDFGFCDSVSKSGKLLFPSVLKMTAARQLAELFGALGRTDKAKAFRNDADKIKMAIPAAFLRPAGKDEAWLDSATEVGRQPDVWGSAFAVYSGGIDELTANQISRALVRAYREKTAVRSGCVRHLLSNDSENRNGWQKTISALGEYQNGGFWGTPVGWYLVAMRQSDEGAAADMARDYIEFLRKSRRADGVSQAWEWFNPDTSKNVNPLYVATVALPYGCLRVAGLLHQRH
jgi:hypothetical protein